MIGIFLIILLIRFVSELNIGSVLLNNMISEGKDPFLHVFDEDDDDDNPNDYKIYNIDSPTSYYSPDLNLSLLIFTVANRISSIGCDTLRLNTNIYNNSINYLGLTHRALNRKITHIYKLTNTFQQLKYLYFNPKYDNDNTIVLFVDAFDVVIQSSASHLLQSFIKLEKQIQVLDHMETRQKWMYPSNIIYFSAETNCYPCNETMYLNEYPYNIDINTRNKYLNAGSWISRVGNAYKFFDLLMKYEKSHVSRETLHSDQYVMHRFFIDLYKNNSANIHVLLDYDNLILKTTYDESIDNNDLSHFINVVKYFHNNGNNKVYPSTLHFNSPAEKQKLKKIIK